MKPREAWMTGHELTTRLQDIGMTLKIRDYSSSSSSFLLAGLIGMKITVMK